MVDTWASSFYGRNRRFRRLEEMAEKAGLPMRVEVVDTVVPLV